MKKITLLSALFLLLLLPAFGQDEAPSPKKAYNVIHADLGILGINLNYERTFKELPKSHFNYRGGFGYVLDFDTNNNFNLIGSIQYITGVKWFHFEAGLGLNYMMRKGWDNDLLEDVFVQQLMPLVMIGLRIEGPGPGPLFRMGVGTEGSIISAGVGWKF